MYTFEEYLKVVQKLQAPDGCPWDSVQTHESLKGCMIDEAAEAVAAIEVLKQTGDAGNLCEELGDQLLLILLQSGIAEKEGLFTIQDVISMACEKMIRRHPHVFSENGEKADWEAIKREEKAKIPENVRLAQEEALKGAKKEIIRRLQV